MLALRLPTILLEDLQLEGKTFPSVCTHLVTQKNSPSLSLLYIPQGGDEMLLSEARVCAEQQAGVIKERLSS